MTTPMTPRGNGGGRAPSFSRPLTPRHSRQNSSSNTNMMSNFSPQARDPNNNNNSGNSTPHHHHPPNDPFIQLEDETEKSLHILQQLRDSHRNLILQNVPEIASNTRGLTAAAGGAQQQHSSSSNSSSSAGVTRPSSLDWQAAPLEALVELDDITQQTEDMISDVTDDLSLLKATVQKHVEGNFDAAYANIDSDEVARRVEIVHAFERKLRLARNELQNMQKARDYRQMQLGDNYQNVSPGRSTANKINIAAKNGEDQNNKNNNNNEFASNYIKQEMEEQNRLTAQHAVVLDQIHVGVISAEDKAKLINQSLKESEQKLSFVDRQIDGIQGKLDSAVQATNKLLEGTSERNKMILICILTAVLVLLIFALFSGNSYSAS